MIRQISHRLESALTEYYPMLRQLTGERSSFLPGTGGWSRQQELGHLVDSAQNNIQRFIRVQYQPLVKVGYHADEWVRANDYNGMSWLELVELWYLLNKQVVRILSRLPDNLMDRTIDVGGTESELHPLSFIAEDYITHMRHHLDHILLPEGPHLA